MYKASKNGAPVGSSSGGVWFWNLQNIGIQNPGGMLCCHLPVQHLFPPLPLASMLSVRTRGLYSSLRFRAAFVELRNLF